MEEIEAVIEGLWIDVRDFDDAADRHLVDQQFKYRLILMRLPLPGGSLEVLRERLAADVTAPTRISNRSLTERCVRPGGIGRDPTGIIGAILVWAAQRSRRRQVGHQSLDFFHDPDVALEREFYAAGRAQAGRNASLTFQRVAIAARNRFLFCRYAIVPTARRFAVVDLDAAVLGRYPRMNPGRSCGRFLLHDPNWKNQSAHHLKRANRCGTTD